MRRSDGLTPVAAAAFLAAAMALAQPALGAGAATGDAAAQGGGAATGESAPVEAIDGFRSARFGMAEAAVLAAIEKDFGLKAGEVAREANPLEKTTALVAQVNDLIPDSGPARIVYILGYKSKALIQVNVVWGRPVVEKPDLKQLATTANILQRYFMERHYAPGSVYVNR
ncbi:MAG: hypothetical protein IRY94_21250, partial [Rhodospirillaceae bacterium]|nr:hypothetical protein [Rhodospirillaceae bacterium]